MSFLKVQWRINNVVRPLQEASVAAQKTPAGFWKLFGIWKDFFFVEMERKSTAFGKISRYAGKTWSH